MRHLPGLIIDVIKDLDRTKKSFRFLKDYFMFTIKKKKKKLLISFPCFK